MISANLVILIAVGYVILLFALAYFSERLAEGDRGQFLRSPLVYTLAISVYCTSWTFYGAVGSAARSGLEFFLQFIWGRRWSLLVGGLACANWCGLVAINGSHRLQI